MADPPTTRTVLEDRSRGNVFLGLGNLTKYGSSVPDFPEAGNQDESPVPLLPDRPFIREELGNSRGRTGDHFRYATYQY